MSALCTHRDRKIAERMAQEVVNIVSTWSKAWKLTLNSSKSEVGFFSTWSREANWEPAIFADNEQIPFKKFPKMLGVVLDRTLSFNEQVTHVTKEAILKLKLLSVLAKTEWGFRKENLMKIHQGFVDGKLGYEATEWQPWLSDTSINNLDVVQKTCHRTIQEHSTGRLENGGGSLELCSQDRQNVLGLCGEGA